jgi:hypothetical protein
LEGASKTLVGLGWKVHALDQKSRRFGMAYVGSVLYCDYENSKGKAIHLSNISHLFTHHLASRSIAAQAIEVQPDMDLPVVLPLTPLPSCALHKPMCSDLLP